MNIEDLSLELIDKQDLFSKRTYGFFHFRIPALLNTKKGTLLAICEARKWISDWATQALVLRRSVDHGKTWDILRPIISIPWKRTLRDFIPFLKKYTHEIVNNPLLIMDQDEETIHLLYMESYCRCFYCQSWDEGLNWSKPVEITDCFRHFRQFYNWNVIATGPGKGIQIQRGKYAGRLIVPIWLAFGKGRSHVPNIAGVIYSDDKGKTWNPGDLVPMTEKMYNLNECYAIELLNGKILLNIRNESHRQTGERYRLYTTSDDGAHQWTPLTFDKGLYEPVCAASLIRCNLHDKAHISHPFIIFSNPCSPNPGKRERLTLKISADEHQTWHELAVLEEGPSVYSDLEIGSDNNIYCLYERAHKNSPFPYDTICFGRWKVRVNQK